ncbi:MAG: glycosyltransferase family 39 protein, partial [Anaerolineae bacterium]
IYGVASQEFWLDEAISAFISSKGWWDILAYVRSQPFEHPPLYYLLLHLWGQVAGWSEFSLRFPSLLLGTLSIPLLHRFLSWLLGKEVAVLVALLAAFSPFLIDLSGEARMYSLVIVLGLLTFLALLWALTKDRPLWWGLWSLLTLAGIATHYYLALLLLTENLFVILYWRRFRSSLWKWASLQFLFFIPALAWMLFSPGPRESVAQIIKVPWLNVRTWPELEQSWQALAIGDWANPTPSLWSRALASVPSLLVLLGALTGRRGAMGKALLDIDRRAWYALLLLLLAAPILGALLIPRNVIARLVSFVIPAYLTFLALGLLALRKMGWFPLGIGGVLLAGAFTLGLDNQWEANKGEFGLVMERLEAQAQPGDGIVLTNPVQWPLVAYYYGGEWPIYYIPQSHLVLITEEEVESSLEAIMSAHPRLWLGPTGPSTMDPDLLVERWLAEHAYQAGKEWFPESSYLAYYFAPQPMESEDLGEVNFGDRIALLGRSHSSREVLVSESLRFAFRWRALEGWKEDWLVSIALEDGGGQVWSQRISPPCGGLCPTSEWREGEEAFDNHALFVPPGTPPGEYRAWLSLYLPPEGRHLVISSQESLGEPRLDLGSVQVTKSAASFSPWGLVDRVDINFEEGFRLLDYHFPSNEWRPGDVIPLDLYWQASTPPQANFSLSLQLVDGWGKVREEKGASLSADWYPTSLWEEGEFVRGRPSLTLLSDLPPGEYRLRLTLLDQKGKPLEAWGRRLEPILGGLWHREIAFRGLSVDLATLKVVGWERNFALPSPDHPLKARLGEMVRLLGYDLEGDRVRPGEEIGLTLYWQALAPADRPYKVFTHLIGEENTIWGQHDSQPVGGTYPPNLW